MQCDEVHAYLAEKLAGRLADKVSGTLQAYVRMHMQACPDCCEQLDDFEEIHATFGLIPLEACDSVAMRLRFQRFMDAEDARIYRASVRQVMAHLTPRWWPDAFSRPMAIAGVAALVVVVVIAGISAAVTAHRAMRPPISSIASLPVVSSPAPKPSPTASEHVVIPAPSTVPENTVSEPSSPLTKPPLAIAIPPAPLPGIFADASGDIPIAVTVRLDTGERLPYKPDTSIVLTDSDGRFRISALPIVGNLFQASVPSGKSYSISVSNVASGYAILSIISGTIDLMNGGRIAPVANTSGGSAPLKIVVTLRKQ